MSRKWHTCLCVPNKSILWMVHYINDLSVWLRAGRAELMFERSGPFSQVTGSVCLQASEPGAVCIQEGEGTQWQSCSCWSFHGVWMWTWFCADIFSCAMCAAVRNNGMCSLPFPVTSERGSALPLKRDLAQYEPWILQQNTHWKKRQETQSVPRGCFQVQEARFAEPNEGWETMLLGSVQIPWISHREADES